MTGRFGGEALATESELALFVAYAASGSIKVAAHQLGLSERTAKRRLERLYTRYDVANAVQLAWVLWGGTSAPHLSVKLAPKTTSSTGRIG